MRPIPFVLLAALLSVGCRSEDAAPEPAPPAPAAARAPAVLPANVAILPDSAALAVVRQCSRAAPENVSGTWAPTVEQVAHADSLLPAFLTPRDPEPRDLAKVARQYAGVVARGRRILYLNAIPMERPGPRDWRTAAMIVCDGGPPFFGAEFDVAEGRFTRVEFNGSLE